MPAKTDPFARIYDALDRLGDQAAQTSTQIAIVSQSVGDLTTSVAELRTDVRDVRDRLVCVETRVDERTRPVSVRRRSSDSDPPRTAPSRAMVAGVVGGGGAGVAALAYAIVRLVEWLQSVAQ